MKLEDEQLKFYSETQEPVSYLYVQQLAREVLAGRRMRDADKNFDVVTQSRSGDGIEEASKDAADARDAYDATREGG